MCFLKSITQLLGISIISATCLIPVAADGETERAQEEKELAQIADQLIAAIRAKDIEKLRTFIPRESGLYSKNTIDQEDIDFLFPGDAIKKSGHLSLLEIIELGPLDRIISTDQPTENEGLILFIPRLYAKETKSNPNFLQSFWMTKYFACSFQKGPDGWLMRQSFCFSQSDGPFPGNN